MNNASYTLAFTPKSGLELAMQALLDYLRPVPAREAAELRVTVSGNEAEISLGRRAFFVRTNAKERIEPEVFDFALFGAMAIAISHNVEITTDLPISHAAASGAERLNAMMELWQPRKTYPAPLRLRNLVDGPASDVAKPRLICLSGGVGSTLAVIETVEPRNITHGMLIAGADYPDAKNPGFMSLQKRVGQIAEKFGLELIIVETSIRKHGFQWEMLHAANLTMCLSLHANQFGRGVIAADQTPAQELAHHPWGNNAALLSALSTRSFPIYHGGRDMSRSKKTRAIMEHPSGAMQHLSVCFEDKTHGGNCVRCTKCIQTRLNIATSDQELPDLFLENEPLEHLISKMPVPKYQMKKRKALAWMLDIRTDLGEGPLRDAVDTYLGRLKSKIIPSGRK